MYAADFAPLVNARQERNGYWTGHCPSHEDNHPSLQISDGNHVVLIKCWAGCQPESICSALGLTLRDLRHESRGRSIVPPAYRRPAPRLCKPP
jgi:hypothetical protein